MIPRSRAEAATLLGVSGQDRDEIETAFRAQARDAHPDAGGSAERFRSLVEARRLLLAKSSVQSTGARVRVTTRSDRILGRWDRHRRRLMVRLGRAAPRVR